MSQITKRARKGRYLTVADIPPRRNLGGRFLGNIRLPGSDNDIAHQRAEKRRRGGK